MHGSAAGSGGREPESITSYRDLVAWQRAMTLAEAVYRATAKFPREERFGLIAQLRRAAVAIPSNIAEGYARGAAADYARFLRIARGSLAEVSTQLELSCKLGYLPENSAAQAALGDAARVLHGLIRAIESSQNPGA